MEEETHLASQALSLTEALLTADGFWRVTVEFSKDMAPGRSTIRPPWIHMSTYIHTHIHIYVYAAQIGSFKLFKKKKEDTELGGVGGEGWI